MSNEHTPAPQDQQAEAVHQFRKAGCADWYDGLPDHEDGGGPYETRTLFPHPAPQDQPVGAGKWGCGYPCGYDCNGACYSRPAPQDQQAEAVRVNYTMCGGCGAADPKERCIGCFHDFGDGNLMSQAYHGQQAQKLARSLRQMGHLVPTTAIERALAHPAPQAEAAPSRDEALCSALPDTFDGKEQHAFEDLAKGMGLDMTEHPLHYLFLNEKTYAARQAWKAAIRYCRSQALAALEDRT